MPNNKQVVDHRERSSEWLEQAEARRHVDEAEADLKFAQVHATLALVDEVRALRESLGGAEIKEELLRQIGDVSYSFTLAANRIGAS